MPNIIDTQQLQATAQVTKSYILEQDTANVTTIINALQQGGSSTPAPAGKQEGIITYDDNQEDPTVTYNGDGAVFCLLYGLKDGDEADEPYFFILCLTELCQNGDMISERDESTGTTTFYLNTWDYWHDPSVYWLVAEETDNYTATALILNH